MLQAVRFAHRVRVEVMYMIRTELCDVSGSDVAEFHDAVMSNGPDDPDVVALGDKPATKDARSAWPEPNARP